MNATYTVRAAVNWSGIIIHPAVPSQNVASSLSNCLAVPSDIVDRSGRGKLGKLLVSKFQSKLSCQFNVV